MNRAVRVALSVSLLAVFAQAGAYKTKEKLGEALYSDPNLSYNRTMSCATCHHEDAAFVDIRDSEIDHMAAFSADDNFIGDRNVPTSSYAQLIPEFDWFEENGEILYVGGQFWDGRASTLKDQAMGPFLNPVEMQMPSKEAVIDRIKEDRQYVRAFKKLYGRKIFRDTEAAYEALADAIGKFEETELFATFDSKYDRYLVGDEELSSKEQWGLELFSDTTRANCVACHPLGEFTDYTYDNLGVPKNSELRALNGMGEDFIDHGLLNNPNVDDPAMDGLFRVSTLRNIAVTGPYMHNGLFQNLKTVVHFYNTRDVDGATNPETGEPWRPSEVPETVNHDELGDLGLSDEEEDAIVAFMKTLTDARYEYMVDFDLDEDNGWDDNSNDNGGYNWDNYWYDWSNTWSYNSNSWYDWSDNNSWGLTDWLNSWW